MAQLEWDSTAWAAGDELTSAEWVDHIEQGHFPADELTFELDGGDPVVVNADTGSVILRWDRATSAWVLDTLTVTSINPDESPATGEVLTWAGSSVEWQASSGGGGGGFETLTTVTSLNYTADANDSVWVDTAAAGGAVSVTTPAEADVVDGDRIEVGVEDATNDTTLGPNTSQSFVVSPPTLTTTGDTVTAEYRASDSTWMVR